MIPALQHPTYSYFVCIPVILSGVIDLFRCVFRLCETLVDGFGGDLGLGQCVDQLFIVQNITCFMPEGCGGPPPSLSTDCTAHTSCLSAQGVFRYVFTLH